MITWESLGVNQLNGIFITSDGRRYDIFITGQQDRYRYTGMNYDIQIRKNGSYVYCDSDNTRNGAKQIAENFAELVNQKSHNQNGSFDDGFIPPEWIEAHDEKIIAKSVYDTDDGEYVFIIKQYDNPKDGAYINIKYPWRDTLTSHGGGFGTIDRAKHAVNNFIKLVSTGRDPRSIHIWEMSVGWRKYTSPRPEFIPVAINGYLFDPNLVDL